MANTGSLVAGKSRRSCTMAPSDRACPASSTRIRAPKGAEIEHDTTQEAGRRPVMGRNHRRQEGGYANQPPIGEIDVRSESGVHRRIEAASHPDHRARHARRQIPAE